jgi:hypothetical protein
MDMTIRAMAHDSYNPNRLNAPQAVRVANAPQVTTAGKPGRGTGWQEPAKLESPSAKGSQVDNIIGGLADKFLGPATPGKPEENK